jgi:hypothetical protein
MPRCRGNKENGTPCERIVGASQDYCYSHDPARANERRRNASRGGRSKGNGELADLKKQVKDLAQDVLEGKADRGRAAVANQLYNTLIRAIEQERKLKELGELAERLEALEEVLKGRKAG